MPPLADHIPPQVPDVVYGIIMLIGFVTWMLALRWEYVSTVYDLWLVLYGMLWPVLAHFVHRCDLFEESLPLLESLQASMQASMDGKCQFF